MPFWSKKGKERAEPSASSTRTQLDPAAGDMYIDGVFINRRTGISLPEATRAEYKERWERECERRRQVYINVTELYGKCSPESNAAEEAALEVGAVWHVPLSNI